MTGPSLIEIYLGLPESAALLNYTAPKKLWSPPPMIMRRRVTPYPMPYPKLIKVLRDRDGDLCGICHDPIDFETTERLRKRSVDHVVPLSKGGGGELTNLQLAHLGCNVARGNRPLI